MQGSHLRLSNISRGSFGGHSRSMLSGFSLLAHRCQALSVAKTAARMYSAVRSSPRKHGRAPKPRKHVIKMSSSKPIVPHIMPAHVCHMCCCFSGSLQGSTSLSVTCQLLFCASTAGPFVYWPWWWSHYKSKRCDGLE